jgi:hypothetical protein
MFLAQDNSLSQGIGQSQASIQLGICVSGDGTLISSNNLSVQNQENEGSANQGIGQSQSSSQRSGVVSGDDLVGSGNNLNFQNQENSGGNVAGQQD